MGIGFPLCFPLLTVFRVQLLIEFLHPAGTVLPHFLGHMAVHIQGELCGCVAQICLYGLDVVACVEGSDGEAVAQIVEPGIVGEVGPLGDLLEMLDHRTADEIFSGGIGEHQVELVFPDTTGEGLFPLLPLLLITEGIHNDGSREDGAVFAALGCFQEVVAVRTLELLLDCHAPGLEIHAVPAQAQQLPLSHSREHGHDEEVAVIVFLGLLQELRDLVRLQGLDLRLDHLRQLAGIGRIGSDVIVCDGLLEGAVEDAVDVFDGLGGQPGSGQGIVKLLDGVGVQSFQLGGTQGRLQMLLRLLGVILLGQGLQVVQILGNPDIQPLRHGHLAGGLVGACVNGSGGGFQLLGDFLLGLAGDAALDLLAGSGVKALRVSGLVVGILLALDGFRDLPDGAHSGGGFGFLFALRHKNSPFVAA